MDPDIGELSNSENEEDDIPRSATELVPVNGVIGGENETGDVQDAGSSSNIATSSTGSTRHITCRA